MSKQHATDLIGLLGVGLIAWGLAMVDPRLSAVVVGALFVLGAILAAR